MVISNNNNSNIAKDNNQNVMTPPDKPDSNNKNNIDPKETPSSDANMENTPQQPPQMPGGNNQNQDQTPPNMLYDKKITNTSSMTYCIIFGIESLLISMLIMYLIMSKFNKKTFKQTFKTSEKLIIYILSTVMLTSALTYLDITIYDKYFQNNNEPLNIENNMNNFTNTLSSDATAANTIDNADKTLEAEYETSNVDESIILVKNGGNLTLQNATVTKTSGDSSNTENSEFYGINAGILVVNNSTSTIKNTKISTNAKGSNAVFSTGTNSKIYISDSTIATTGSSSARGLDATYGGYIEADNVTITTQGASCAALATDRGEGTIITKNSTLETNGTGSPVVYSTGDISISNTKGVANGSQMVVIEGKNKATITNSTLEASAKGNRDDVDQAGIMIYQSMSGDATEGTGNLSATDSTLSIQSDSAYYKSAPMFFITNTTAIINLENTKLNYGSNILISAKGTSEWGNTTSNGGQLTFNATNQTLTGNIELDTLSTLTLNLKDNSTYKGIINKENTAKNITLKLDETSKITLTGNSYITSLENADSSNSNIDFNGYKLYVNGTAIN